MGHHRQEDGREDQDRRGHVHEGSHQKEDEVDDQEDDERTVADAEEAVAHVLRDVLIGHDPGETDAGAYQQQNDGRGFHRPQDDIRQVFDLHLPVDERQDQGVEDRHGRRFGGGEVSGDDASHDDDQQQQAGQGIQESFHAEESPLPVLHGAEGDESGKQNAQDDPGGVQDGRRIMLCDISNTHDRRHDQDKDRKDLQQRQGNSFEPFVLIDEHGHGREHQGYTGEDAGDISCHKKSSDGSAAAGQRIDDQHIARWDGKACSGGGDVHRSTEMGIVALLAHLRVHDAADG